MKKKILSLVLAATVVGLIPVFAYFRNMGIVVCSVTFQGTIDKVVKKKSR